MQAASAQDQVGDPSVTASLVICLGLSQLVAWGCLHYIIGVFGADIGKSLGWSQVVVHGGFSCALVVMGLTSKAVGAWIDRSGGRATMLTGFWTGALGCVLLSVANDVAGYFLAWVVLGLAMRMSLYDATFATLVRVGGSRSQKPIAMITLFGGLASTAFWPLGHMLATAFCWRGAVLCYAAILVASSLLLLKIPVAKPVAAAGPGGVKASDSLEKVPFETEKTLVFGLSALLILFMQAGMAAHMIGLLSGLGWSAESVVAVSALFGVGQVSGRLYMALHGHRFPILRMNFLPPALLLVCFGLYPLGDKSLAVAAAFAFLFGAGNGISTITRGAVPVVLFGPKGYGARMGAILRPAFFASAVAPIALAGVITRWGTDAAVAINFVASLALLASAGMLVRLNTNHMEK